jgi:hypothetical protein
VLLTWVRFEAAAGVGSHAVLAADRSEFFMTGAFALLGVVLTALLFVALTALAAAGWVWVQRRGGHGAITRARTVIGRISDSGAWAFGVRHPWILHLTVPVIVVVWLKWGLPALDVRPPAVVRVSIAILMLVLLLIGLFRGFVACVTVAIEGGTRVARQLRWALPLLTAPAIFLSIDNWEPLLLLVVVLAFVPYAIFAARRYRARLVAEPWSVAWAERPAIAAFIVAVSVALAIAGQADRPTGLQVVWVTPASGAAFGAISLGERHGLEEFLKITRDAKIVRYGEIGLPAGQVRSVRFLYTVSGPRNHHTLARRLLTWLSEPEPSLRG